MKACRTCSEGKDPTQFRPSRPDCRACERAAAREYGASNPGPGTSAGPKDGASFEEVATMLGDSVEITRKHYAVFSPTYLRGVVNSIAGARA